MGSKSTEVGRTGARFAGAGRQHGHHRAPETPAWPTPERAGAEPPEADPTPAAPPVTGARFGPHSERHRVRDADPTPEFVPDPEPVRRSPVDERLPLESEVLIRPYARTGGRTKPNRTLALEALITTSSDLTGIAYRQWSAEHKMIANLCVRPRSVAEVAALLCIPLGVARILVGDMATDGSVVINGSSGQRPPDLVLMRRVLAGLRRL